MSDSKKNPMVQMILLSLAGFVLFWTIVTDAWGYSSHLAIHNGSYIYAYLSRLVWIVPAIWLIFRYSAFMRYDKKTLFSRPVWNKSLAAVLAISVIYAVGMMLVTHGGFWLNPSVNLPLEILKFVLVAIVEEVVFRGWGFNALAKSVTEKKAILYSTIFFVLLHWPAYFIRLFRFGTMDFAEWLIQSLTAALWGVVCCMLLKKGKTLWNPIISHFVYDVLYVLLVG